MIDFLLGVPGKLATISTYLTTNLSALRAAKIDNLDAAISTRAPASTALSNATWTSAHATAIDTILTKVTALEAAAESTPIERLVVVAVNESTSASLNLVQYTCPTGKTAYLKATSLTNSFSQAATKQFYVGSTLYTLPGTAGTVAIAAQSLTAGQTIRVYTSGAYANTVVNANLFITEYAV